MLDRGEKAKFKENAHQLDGSSLQMAIRQRVKLTPQSDLVQQALATGHMLDEAKLKEKYGSKPDELTAVFKNAVSIACPTTKITLWADPDFASEWLMRQCYSGESAAKKQKTEKAPPTDSEETTLTPEKAPPIETTLTPLDRFINPGCSSRRPGYL